MPMAHRCRHPASSPISRWSMMMASTFAPSSRLPHPIAMVSSSVTISSDSRLTAAFPRMSGGSGAALITYLTAGFPDRDTSLQAIRAAAEHSDILEVGVPFSDPVADGPVIQAASHRALARGMTLPRTLDLISEAAVSVPVVLFSYLNPVISYGVDGLLDDASSIGVAGLLLTDLPAGADPELENAVRHSPLDLIRLAAPTSSRDRLDSIADGAEGFVYLIARMGVTGISGTVDAGLADQIRALRQVTDLPVAAGFGISDEEQARAVGSMADGVIVGSRAVKALEEEGVAGLSSALVSIRKGARAG